jgi:L-fuconolactonase
MIVNPKAWQSAGHVMNIIDTHMHLWDTGLYTYSWTRGSHIFNRTFELPEYIEAAYAAAITQCVFVEADVDEPFILDETLRVLLLAERDSRIAGVVADGRPENRDFAMYLENIADRPK